jgi:SulP family sulfate permease
LRYLKRILPILEWAPDYTRANAGSDLTAAVIVTIMLVPQSLAYAMLAGLPAQVGLYASIAPLVAYAVFGTSRTLAVGPVAIISLMTAAAVSEIAPQHSEAYLAAATTLALLSGLVLAAMSVLRLGFIANFLSHPVISGFISASGILIAAGQVRHLFGIAAEGNTLQAILHGLWSGAGSANAFTAAIGLASLAFLYWVRSYLHPMLLRAGMPPQAAQVLVRAGPVVAIAGSIMAVYLFALDGRGVRIVGDIPSGLPPLVVPSLDLALIRQLILPAVLISLVGFVESVSVAQTLAAKRRQRIEPNQELLGLGAANLACAFSGGYPVTGGFARSVVNHDAGAQTPMAGAYTSLGILGATLFLTPLFKLLPQAVLAATIIVAVMSLVDIGAIRRTWIYSKADFSAMAVTIGLVLTVGVEAGIVAGVLMSLLLFLWRTSKPHIAVVGRVPGTEHFRNVDRHAVLTDPAILTIRVDESLYFANARMLEDTIYERVLRQPELKHVVLMCSAVNFIDASALESLEAIAARLHAAGVEFHLSEVKGPVMDALKRSDFFDHFNGQVFLSQYGAVTALSTAVARQ